MTLETMVNPFTPPSSDDPATLRCNEETDHLAEIGLGSDLDASLRFAKANADVLKYSPGVGWLWWDKRRWASEGEGRAMELQKQCARQWLIDCAKDDNPDRKRAAIGLESGSHIRAAVELAKSDPRLVITVAELDADPWTLNVLNGTLDLRTGRLQPHDRANLITKLAPVKFDPDDQHDVLRRYLEVVERDSPGMADFSPGVLAPPSPETHHPKPLFLLQGDGGSGKTTLIEAVSVCLGDYATKLNFESLCQSKHGRSPGAASPDLLPLRGARLAYASEGDASARLDAGKVKELTGNEPVTARGLYQRPITFSQTWKLWLVSNFAPKADSEDTGIWRRMLKLHFNAIPESQRDPAVKRLLTTDPDAKSALLAWAVKGCLDWQSRGGGRAGLAPPDAVKKLTDAYRIKQDSLAEWWGDLLTDYCLRPNAFTPTSELRRHYEEWCEDEGATPCLAKRFNVYLETKGLVKGRGTAGVKGWRGITTEIHT